jgi:hypothetical protein
LACRWKCRMQSRTPSNLCPFVAWNFSSTTDYMSEPRALQHSTCHWIEWCLGSDGTTRHIQSKEIRAFLEVWSGVYYGSFCVCLSNRRLTHLVSFLAWTGTQQSTPY